MVYGLVIVFKVHWWVDAGSVIQALSTLGFGTPRQTEKGRIKQVKPT